MIKKTNNRIIKSRGGKIFKFIDKNNNFYKNFGEIYINHIKKNKKKIDWIYHKKCQCLITVIVGKVDFIFKSRLNKKKIITLESKKNHLLVISSKTWFRFESKTRKSIFLNLIDKVHNPRETIRDTVN
tara:strand:- start:141 stop:524 length:384 start_codon:yes stop_codon:yes gene_type:complete